MNQNGGKMNIGKEPKKNEVSIWWVVCILLIMTLVYLSTGGIWEGNSVDEMTCAEKVIESVSSDIENIQMNLKDVDVVAHLVDSNKVEVDETFYNNKEFIVELKENNGKVVIQNRQMEDRGFRWFNLFRVKNDKYHKIEVNIPNSFRGELKIESTSGEIKVEDPLILAKLEVKTTSGDIQLEEVEAESKIVSTSGVISIEKIKGENYEIRTTSGDIHLKEGQGNLTLATTSGESQLGCIVGDKHKLNSTSADISIEEMQGEYEVGSTSGCFTVEKLKGYGVGEFTSGDVCIEEIELEGDMNFKTISGDIQLMFNEDVSASVDMNSRTGNIEGDVDIKYTNHHKTKATTQLGDHSLYTVEIQTTSGEIYIEQDS